MGIESTERYAALLSMDMSGFNERDLEAIAIFCHRFADVQASVRVYCDNDPTLHGCYTHGNAILLERTFRSLAGAAKEQLTVDVCRDPN